MPRYATSKSTSARTSVPIDQAVDEAGVAHAQREVVVGTGREVRREPVEQCELTRDGAGGRDVEQRRPPVAEHVQQATRPVAGVRDGGGVDRVQRAERVVEALPCATLRVRTDPVEPRVVVVPGGRGVGGAAPADELHHEAGTADRIAAGVDRHHRRDRSSRPAGRVHDAGLPRGVAPEHHAVASGRLEHQRREVVPPPTSTRQAPLECPPASFVTVADEIDGSTAPASQATRPSVSIASSSMAPRSATEDLYMFDW